MNRELNLKALDRLRCSHDEEGHRFEVIDGVVKRICTCGDIIREMEECYLCCEAGSVSVELYPAGPMPEGYPICQVCIDL